MPTPIGLRLQRFMRDRGLLYRIEDWQRVPTAVLVWAEGDDIPDLEDLAAHLQEFLEPGERIDLVYTYRLAKLREALGELVCDIATARKE